MDGEEDRNDGLNALVRSYYYYNLSVELAMGDRF